MAKARDSGKKKSASHEGRRGKAERSGNVPSTAMMSVVVAALPSTRAELLDLHAEARRRRNAVPSDSEAYREAVAEIARIEVQIARIERAMDPPLG